MKGWLIDSRIFHSFFTWSICFNLIISVFLSILSAIGSHLELCLYLTNRTHPNVPVPKIVKIKFTKCCEKREVVNSEFLLASCIVFSFHSTGLLCSLYKIDITFISFWMGVCVFILWVFAWMSSNFHIFELF